MSIWLGKHENLISYVKKESTENWKKSVRGKAGLNLSSWDKTWSWNLTLEPKPFWVLTSKVSWLEVLSRNFSWLKRAAISFRERTVLLDGEDECGNYGKNDMFY